MKIQNTKHSYVPIINNAAHVNQVGISTPLPKYRQYGLTANGRALVIIFMTQVVSGRRKNVIN